MRELWYTLLIYSGEEAPYQSAFKGFYILKMVRGEENELFLQ